MTCDLFRLFMKRDKDNQLNKNTNKRQDLEEIRNLHLPDFDCLELKQAGCPLLPTLGLELQLNVCKYEHSISLTARKGVTGLMTKLKAPGNPALLQFWRWRERNKTQRWRQEDFMTTAATLGSKSPSSQQKQTAPDMIGEMLIQRDISARGSAERARVVVAVELVVGQNNSLSDAAYGCSVVEGW